MSIRGRKPELRAIDGGLKGVPKAPAHIHPEMVEEWNIVVSDMVERKILTAAMVSIVAVYVTALRTVRECEKAINEHGLLVSSAHEKLKPNPACGILKSSMETVARLAGELGLTPAARSKSGFQPKGGADDDLSDLGL